jgi:murein DD-endopeptidase MepM/ murein hydrolase activator NlpD
MESFKKICIGVLVATLFILFSVPLYANSQKSIEYRIQGLQRGLNEVTLEYEKAYSGYLLSKERLEKSEKELQEAKKKKEWAQRALCNKLEYLYKYGEPSFIEVLITAKSLSEAYREIKYFLALSQAEKELLIEARNSISEWKKKKESYEKEKSTYKKRLLALSEKKEELLKKLSFQKKLLQQSKRRVAVARKYRVSRATSYRIGSFVFPVAGPHSYIDSFGAPRVGHRHQGTDIMAPHGTPVVACVSGTVRTSSGGSGGIMLWIHGNDGNTYFYAHLSGYASGIHSGARVSAGQVVGYVGNTGNARGGAPHLHFEVHPGGGRAVNPYPILRAAE